jgi:hypothetical protein
VTCIWGTSRYSINVPTPNGNKEADWFSQDTPNHPQYSLEANAPKVSCDGVKGVARR